LASKPINRAVVASLHEQAHGGGQSRSGSRIMRIRVILLAAALMMAPLAARATDLLIGIPGSMTGPNAFRGEQQQRGVGRAVADLNALGGVLGKPLRIEVVDDFCDGAQAVAVAAKLVSDGAVFIAGHLCSGASIPAAAVYAQAGIPMISPSSTNPALTEAGYPNVFRVVGRDDMQGTIAGDYLAERWSGQDIAILHDGLPYGVGLARLTKTRLNERGVTEIVFDAIVPSEADYSEVVARLRAAGVDVLYYGGYATEAGLIIRQAHDVGYDLRMVGGDGVNNEDFWLIAGPAGEGTRDLRPGPARQPSGGSGRGEPPCRRVRARGLHAPRLCCGPGVGAGRHEGRVGESGSGDQGPARRHIRDSAWNHRLRREGRRDRAGAFRLVCLDGRQAGACQVGDPTTSGQTEERVFMQFAG
jgi:branched-chain amino acid transport system substrate-binding protein